MSRARATGDAESPARRAVAALGLALRHPKDAYRALYAASLTPAPLPEVEADHFELAMNMLTGLDVSLTFKREGVHWCVPPGQDGIAAELFRTGAYGRGTLQAVQAFVSARRPDRDWIIDIGANIGSSTLPFALAGWKVIAIEPVPRTAAYLRSNVERNGLTERVRIVQAAITPDGREVLIATSTSLGSSEVVDAESATPGFVGRFGRGATIEVPGCVLSSVVESEAVPPASIALVWCDVQGSEPAVIETGAALWLEGVPLLAEFWPQGLELRAGLDAFLEGAQRHFRSFVDCANGGVEVTRMLDSDAASGPRPISELRELAADVVFYPGNFTDVLLLP